MDITQILTIDSKRHTVTQTGKKSPESALILKNTVQKKIIFETLPMVLYTLPMVLYTSKSGALGFGTHADMSIFIDCCDKGPNIPTMLLYMSAIGPLPNIFNLVCGGTERKNKTIQSKLTK